MRPGIEIIERNRMALQKLSEKKRTVGKAKLA
jgi:hypothetical protein